MTQYEIRACGSEDEAALLALHNRCFGPPRWDAAWLRWRFSELPSAPSEILGAFRSDGTCQAMYAGVAHRGRLDGEEVLVLNHSDIAIAPELREGLGGAGLLLRMARRYFGAHGGGETALMYGVPEPGLRRLVVGRLRVEVLADVVFLAHDLTADLSAPDEVHVRKVDGFDPAADLLWDRAGAEFGAALVRDASYLNRRYRDHPGVDYTLLEVRDPSGDGLRGLAVLRQGGWDAGLASLVDWLVLPEDIDAERALIAAGLDFARARGRSALVAMFQVTDPRFLRFQEAYGFLALASPYQIVFRSYRPGIDRAWLHQRWYQTMGEMDFF